MLNIERIGGKKHSNYETKEGVYFLLFFLCESSGVLQMSLWLILLGTEATASLCSGSRIYEVEIIQALST